MSRRNPRAERVGRDHDLGRAYRAAMRLEQRLELAGEDPLPARRIRHALAGRMIRP